VSVGESERRSAGRPRLEGVADFVATLAAAGALLIIVATVWGLIAPSDAAESSQPSVEIENWERFSAVGHRLGPADASVTIVEFGDYRCRYCREAEPHLAAIRRRYGERVALVFRHFPLARESVSYIAARGAECAAEQGAFWVYHERLLSDREWLSGDPSIALVRMGVEVGAVDVAAFEACLKSTEPVPAVTADLEAAGQLGIVGTPAFLVNDHLLMGVLDSLEFDRIYREVR